MASIDRTQKTIKEIFLKKCWEYLNQNFHSFSKANQIKIALTLCGKDVAQIVEQQGGGETKIIIVRPDSAAKQTETPRPTFDIVRPNGRALSDASEPQSSGAEKVSG